MPTITPASSRRSVCCTPRARPSVSSTASTAPTKAAPVSAQPRDPAAGRRRDAQRHQQQRHAEVGARGAAQQVGVGQRIAKQPLRQRAARGPSSAPASQAPSVRGRRMSRTICSADRIAAAPQHAVEAGAADAHAQHQQRAAEQQQRPAPVRPRRPFTWLARSPQLVLQAVGHQHARPRPCAGRAAPARRLRPRVKTADAAVRAPRRCRPSPAAAPAPLRAAVADHDQLGIGAHHELGVELGKGPERGRHDVARTPSRASVSPMKEASPAA